MVIHKLMITLVSCMLVTGQAWAGSVTANISFSKKAPTAAVLYQVKSDYSMVNGEVDQTDKQFTNGLVVSSPGSKMVFRNSDTFEHNIFANDLANGVQFDVGLMPVGAESDINVDWNEETLVRIGCKIHPKMRSYIANIASDNYTVVPMSKKIQEYSLKLDDVGDSAAVFVLLLPKYDMVKVSLAAGEEKTVELMRKGKSRGSVTLTRL